MKSDAVAYEGRTEMRLRAGVTVAVAVAVAAMAGGGGPAWAQAGHAQGAAPHQGGAGDGADDGRDDGRDDGVDDGVDDGRDELPLWDEGVSAERRQRARALLDEGNRLIKVPLFAQAAERYEEALAIWNHPALHYNLGVAQLNLVRLTEAYRSFEESLRHGPEPLGQDKFQQAKEYLALLDTRLARVEVVCEVAGAEVTLDGERLFIGPGRHEQVVSPGRHQLVAGKAEHVPDTKQLALSPGERVRHVMRPRLLDDIAERERRWAVWKPWAVIVAGAGVVAGAAYLDRTSSQGFDRFDQGFEAECLPRGCQGSEIAGLVEQKEAAELRQSAALGLYMAGGTALAAGAVLVYFNRERLVQGRSPGVSAGVSITPSVTPSGGGLSARISF